MGEREDRQHWRIGAAVAAFVLAAAAIWFRSAGLLGEPLWLDEAYSAYAASKGFGFLWAVVPLYETHPPFYYSLLRGWTLIAGDSLGGLRSLGVVCGIATLPIMMLAAQEIARLLGLDRIGAATLCLAALALGAFSPSLVEMTREVRPYPVMILVYATACFAVLRLGRRVRDGAGIAGRPYALYLATLALILWLHNLGPIYGLAIGLALLALVLRPGLKRRDWMWLVGGHLLVAIIYLPALAIMLDQAPTWIRSTWLKFSLATLPAKLGVLYAGPGRITQLAALLLALLAIGRLFRSGEGARIAAALLLLAIVPVAVSVTLSATVAPIFIMRTMTAIAVPALLLLAAGVATQRGWWRWVALGPLLVMLSQFVVADIHARRSGPMQDWYAALRWLEPRFRPGDRVYAYPNEGALPFDYAVRDLGLAMPSRAIPSAIPALNPPPGSWYVSGSRGVPSLDRPHLRAIAESPEARRVPTIWLLRLGPWAYDKGDVFVEELRRERTRIARYRDGPIDIIGLRRISPGPAAPAGAAAAR